MNDRSHGVTGESREKKREKEKEYRSIRYFFHLSSPCSEQISLNYLAYPPARVSEREFLPKRCLNSFNISRRSAKRFHGDDPYFLPLFPPLLKHGCSFGRTKILPLSTRYFEACKSSRLDSFMNPVTSQACIGDPWHNDTTGPGIA